MLTTEQKTFVVQQLAMYQTPTEVADLVNERFDITVTRQAVAKYHPEHYSDLALIWREIFYATRQKFIEQIMEIPLAHQSYRLKQLQDSLDRVKRSPRKNEAMIHSILEQASKEVGGMFTNQRQITGANGKPLFDPVEMAKAVFADLTAKEGMPAEEAIQFVVDRYKVDQEVLVSEANN